MRHLLSMLTATVILLLSPNKLLAYWDFEYQSLYFKITDPEAGTVEVVSPKLREGTISIPATAEYRNREYKVTAIGRRAFADCENLMAVSIPEGVVEIGHSAFRNCASMVSCAMPQSVKHIGKDAFMDCKNLRSIYIGPEVGKVDVQAFYRCASLEKVTIEAAQCSLEIHAFEDCKSLSTIILKCGQIPTAASTTFRNVPASAEIFAGKKCVSRIRKDPNWEQFQIIHAIK